MTVVDSTARAQREVVSFELELPHAPQKVWRALTDPALLAQWLLPVAGFRLEVGAAFTFQGEPQPGWDASVRCQVLEIEAQRRLRYTWEDDDLDTVVTFTLEPTASGTRLSLVHSGFGPDQRRNFGGARYGWKRMAEALAELLAQRP